MFNTKNLVHNVKDVPDIWIFEYFCKLKEKLEGQDIKIKSIFNPKERTPSMCIYLDKTKKSYKFKDFSTGKGGSGVDLVKEMKGLSFHEACRFIIESYNDFVLHNNGGYDVKEFKEYSKYKVTGSKKRTWTTQDQYFWTQFNIGSKLLEEYNVFPLESYTMSKNEEGVEKELIIKGNYIYGYFKKDGTLYKIYQPKTLDKKFIKVTDYIQGTEQLSTQPYLIITSSLKDVMSLKSLKLSVDCIAPHSENSILPDDKMNDYLDRYKKIIVMFDYDEAGIKAMEKYKSLYPFVLTAILPMSKDISDSIKDFGAKEVRMRLVPILDKKISF